MEPFEKGYELSQSPIYENGSVTRYSTDEPTVIVDRFEVSTSEFKEFLEDYEIMKIKLSDIDFDSYTPEIVDYDLEDRWIAFGIEPGLYSLSEVVKSLPDEVLDGRDWAWMIRRVFIVLHQTLSVPVIDNHNLLVHPEGHGVVLLGWRPGIGDEQDFFAGILELMDRYLMRSEDVEAQQKFIRSFARFAKLKGPISPEQFLSEFELKLKTLYGVRRFRELKVNDQLSKPYSGAA